MITTILDYVRQILTKPGIILRREKDGKSLRQGEQNSQQCAAITFAWYNVVPSITEEFTGHVMSMDHMENIVSGVSVFPECFSWVWFTKSTKSGQLFYTWARDCLLDEPCAQLAKMQGTFFSLNFELFRNRFGFFFSKCLEPKSKSKQK